jgi:hypothetical protein
MFLDSDSSQRCGCDHPCTGNEVDRAALCQGDLVAGEDTVDKLARTQVLRAASAQELGRATERESASVMGWERESVVAPQSWLAASTATRQNQYQSLQSLHLPTKSTLGLQRTARIARRGRRS